MEGISVFSVWCDVKCVHVLLSHVHQLFSSHLCSWTMSCEKCNWKTKIFDFSLHFYVNWSSCKEAIELYYALSPLYRLILILWRRTLLLFPTRSRSSRVPSHLVDQATFHTYRHKLLPHINATEFLKTVFCDVRRSVYICLDSFNFQVDDVKVCSEIDEKWNSFLLFYHFVLLQWDLNSNPWGSWTLLTPGVFF